ncbi:eukaryotic translation initiation factor 5B-like [Magnolia sinica]|uniref:eukaryotic translation initiation factor 5B-like n=1 Tax=Magnolia sinica TaxID=86752 RepID=UPI0026581787|nr:eukaryotic translation initiation factor 5B-like [Magnolia sinica]
MGRKKPAGARDEEIPISTTAQGGNKSKKKGHAIDDDEYSIGTELSEDPPNSEKQDFDDNDLPSLYGKKKGKKGGAKARLVDEDQEKKPNLEAEEDDPPPVVFSGKKKSKSKKSNSSLFTASPFDALEEDDDASQPEDPPEADDEEDSNDVPVIAFSGKKKPSKSSNKGGSLFNASSFDASLDDEDSANIAPATEQGSSGNDVNEEDDVPEISIAFSGKKKPSKSSKKVGNSLTFLDSVGLDDEDAIETATGTSGKIEDGDDENDDAQAAISFSGKKKSSKSKSSKKSNSLSNTFNYNAVLGEQVNEHEQPSVRGGGSNEAGGKDGVDAKTNNKGSENMADTSKKQKKNKKKSGRTAQEEDDLDKILAELGEGPPLTKPAPPPEEKVQVKPDPVSSVDATIEEKDGEAEGGESVAAKKKKKKKEKEKEKKAAAAAAVEVKVKEEKHEETKSKVSDKKVPKHVREMQEALARRKEAEERKKREEEERLRKEEEERRRLEEIERLAEEAKRRKKEREKEKLLKKKQEGKLLTGKQKEEARRLESMRNQFLAKGSLLPMSDTGTTTTTKRPKYQNKKGKSGPSQANGGASVKPAEAVEANDSQHDIVPEVEPSEVEKVEEESTAVDANEKMEVEQQEVEENGVEEEDDDDDEWDAKSWDNADLSLPVKSAFAEEDAEPVVKKDIKRVTQPASVNSEVPSPAQPNPAITAKKAAAPESFKSHEIESKDDEPQVEVYDKRKIKEAAKKREARTAEALSQRSADNLRSPICCILGHVDTGKTKLLDCIRGTNVQEGEAGGITQQIGATYFPAENLRDRTKELKADAKLRVPGLLVIDTPGHESFTNLRSRGSGLCDIAILVVDIMHGLEQQTIESLNLLKMRNTEFIVALNKVDRLYGWKTCPNAPIVKAMKQQSNDVQNEFKRRVTEVITQLKEQGLNTELYYKNKEMGETFSIVPTSAVSGEGIPDLLLLLVQWTQKTMEQKLMFVNEVQCTVLEVKVIEGLGTTIDVVLVNGVLHEGDQIVVCGMQGPIVTTIRALLTPHPMKELRVKGSYQHHKELKAAQGIKITAQGLEHAIAGTGLYVVGSEDDLEDIKEASMQDMKTVMSRIDKSGEGVCVQASTLGSLEALLEFLKSPAVNIPVSGISIGPVHKRDVMRASVMLERKKEYATILAFDVKVTPEARELADETGVKIFIADIIYHLFDQFKAYIDNLKEEKKKEAAEDAVFPCVLKIMPNCIFNKKDPIVLGVDVLEGIAKVGTPICIPSRDFIDIGRIASIEINHKQVDIAKKGQKVAIKIASTNAEEQQKMYGRHFEIDDELVSHISRKSIDTLKSNYRDDLSIEEWKLVVKLKTLFKIQ